MEQYIDKSTLVAEIERRLEAISSSSNENNRELAAIRGAQQYELINLVLFLNTLEVKEVNEVPATVMVNKYGNRFISSWAGLKEYDDFKEGEEIKIVILKK